MTEPTQAAGHAPALTVIGEAVIDMVQLEAPGDYRARPGGGPFDVAVGLARLGHKTALMAGLANHTLGRMLRTHATADRVDLTACPHTAEPTTPAVVSMNAQGRASYDSYLDGTADWQGTQDESARIPPDNAVLQFGSVASWTPPGSDHVHTAHAPLTAAGLAFADGTDNADGHGRSPEPVLGGL